MKKVLAIILSMSMALTAFAGCGSKETSSSEPASGGSQVSSEEAPENPVSEEAAEPQMVTVIDHADREVTLEANPDRVVVCDILPMASVLTVFLGSAEKLVGINPACMSAAKNGLLGEIFPEILEADTSFTEGGNVNVEKLLTLEPDVVFTLAGNSSLIGALENAGVTVVGISPSKFKYDILETYDQWISVLSQIFPENAKSEEISDYSKEVYEQIQTVTADIPEEERKDILFLYQYDDTQMVTSGQNFFGQFWAEAVGGHNAAEEVKSDNSNAIITMEQVYEWDPDVIFVTNFTPTQPEDLYNNAIGSDDWSSVKAVQEGNVYKLPLGTYRSYTPSADTPVTLLWMAQKVYPELFADVDIAAEVREYYQQLYGVSLTDEQIDRMYNPSSAAAEGDYR
ncbi:MAG: ABC transporter substrate-binding protein [Oscillospiraceae bacterium]|nr:ABC transporter substrate-binding protein [Oscillospiraceae bacterium]